MLTRFSIPLLAACGLAALFTSAAPLGAQAPAQLAPRDAAAAILRETGVRGGFVVHLGCGDARLTAALRAGEAYQVHGLARDAAQLAAARQRLHKEGVYGNVSLDLLAGDRLPYIDNFVNLVVAEDPGKVTQGRRSSACSVRAAWRTSSRTASGRRRSSRSPRRSTIGRTISMMRRAIRWPTIRSSPRRSGCNGSARRAGRGITTAWPA